jgi:uridine kinase
VRANRPSEARASVVERLSEVIGSARLTHPTRVAVDGPDAAGKTTLANEIAAALRGRGRSVLRASVDGFHRPRAQRYQRGPESPEGYYEDAFDLDALRGALLDPLGPGGTRDYRPATFDYRADRPVSSPAVRAPADAVLVFDGVFLLRPELLASWDIRIFVVVGFEQTLRRALERDEVLFGSREEVERRYRRRYIPAQWLYFEAVRPQTLADIVVRNDDPEAPVLERLGSVLSPGRGRPAR